MSHPPSVFKQRPINPLATTNDGKSRKKQRGGCGVVSWLILMLGALAVVVWWWWNSQEEEKTSGREAYELPPSVPTREITLEPPPSPTPAQPAPDEEETPAFDDLTHIRGIGPKIASVLADAGLPTFTSLADADPVTLAAILGETLTRLADPGSWPEQARLAAGGDWEALGALQERLKAGRS